MLCIRGYEISSVLFWLFEIWFSICGEIFLWLFLAKFSNFCAKRRHFLIFESSCTITSRRSCNQFGKSTILFLTTAFPNYFLQYMIHVDVTEMNSTIRKINFDDFCICIYLHKKWFLTYYSYRSEKLVAERRSRYTNTFRKRTLKCWSVKGCKDMGTWKWQKMLFV